jgi:HD-GYP domain-containing protein (c-di-GMP phosphodiesterase class II)
MSPTRRNFARARVTFVRGELDDESIGVLTGSGFEIAPVDGWRETFERAEPAIEFAEVGGTPGEPPVPTVVLLGRAHMLEALDDDRIRLRHLQRRHVGVVAKIPEGEMPLSEVRARAVLDEIFWPCRPAALRRAMRNAAERVRLEIEKAELRRELGRRTRQLRELNDVGGILAAERDLPRLMDSILRKARVLTGADAGAIYLVDTLRRDQLHFISAQNDSIVVPFRSASLPLDSQTIPGYCAFLRQSINIDDAYALPVTAPFSFDPADDAAVGYRTKSVLVVPIMDHDRNVIGVLELINRKVDGERIMLAPLREVETDVIGFDAESESFMASFALQAAVAISHALSISRLRERLDTFVKTAAAAIEAREPERPGHSTRVRQLADALARAVDEAGFGPFAATRFDDDQRRGLGYAAMLHDLGKISVPEAVLTKSRKLLPDTLRDIRRRIALRLRDREIERLRDELPDPGGPDSVERLARLEAAGANERETMEALLRDVIVANEVGAVQPDTLNGLRERGALTWRDDDGAERPLLESHELAALADDGPLNPAERTAYQAHVQQSVDMVSVVDWPRQFGDVARTVALHHEYLDGSGYPQGVTAPQIPLAARILTIANVFDNLVGPGRRSTAKVSFDAAVSRITAEAERGRLDPHLVRLFVENRCYEPAYRKVHERSLATESMEADLHRDLDAPLDDPDLTRLGGRRG